MHQNAQILTLKFQNIPSRCSSTSYAGEGAWSPPFRLVVGFSIVHEQYKTVLVVRLAGGNEVLQRRRCVDHQQRQQPRS